MVLATKTDLYSALGEGTPTQGGARQSVDKSLNLPWRKLLRDETARWTSLSLAFRAAEVT